MTESDELSQWSKQQHYCRLESILSYTEMFAAILSMDKMVSTQAIGVEACFLFLRLAAMTAFIALEFLKSRIQQ